MLASVLFVILQALLLANAAPLLPYTTVYLGGSILSKGNVSSFSVYNYSGPNPIGSRRRGASFYYGSPTYYNVFMYGGEGTTEDGERAVFGDMWQNAVGTQYDDYAWVLYGSEHKPQINLDLGPDSITGSREGMQFWQQDNQGIFVFGGYFPKSDGSVVWYNDTWFFNPSLGDWHLRLNESIPQKRTGATTWVNGSDSYYMFGGKFETYLSDIWYYTNTSNIWNPVTPSSPGPTGRVGSASVFYNNLLHLFGGTDDTGILGDLWIFDGNKWTRQLGQTDYSKPYYGNYALNGHPGGRTGATMFVSDDNGLAYLFGGYGYAETGEPVYLNDMWRYDLVKKIWTWENGLISEPGTQNVQIGQLATPDPRSDFYFWNLDTTYYFFGGIGENSNSGTDEWKFARELPLLKVDYNLTSPSSVNITWSLPPLVYDDYAIYFQVFNPVGVQVYNGTNTYYHMSQLIVNHTYEYSVRPMYQTQIGANNTIKISTTPSSGPTPPPTSPPTSAPTPAPTSPPTPGPTSPPTPAPTVGPTASPEIPNQVSLNFPQYTRNFILATWSAPSNTIATQYSLIVTSYGFSKTFNTTQLSQLVTGLQEDTVYMFQVAAGNAAGFGASSFANFSTLAAYCGDGICDAGETCSSCPIDCSRNCSKPKCPGTPECSGHGSCSSSQVCECNDPWSGDDCNYKIAPTPIVRAADSSTGVSIQTESATFSVFVDSIKEIDNSGVVLSEIKINAEGVSAEVQNLVSPGGVPYIQYNYSVTLQNGANLQVVVSVFNSSTSVLFANNSIDVDPNSVKYTLQVTNWPFQAIRNFLQIVMDSSASTSSTKEECTTSVAVSTDSGDNLLWMKVVVNGTTLYGTFLDYALVDDEISSVKFSGTESNTLFSVTIPHFWNYAIIDPDFSVLVSNDPVPQKGGCFAKHAPQHGISKGAIIGIVVGVVGGMILAVILFFVFRRLQDTKLFIRWRHGDIIGKTRARVRSSTEIRL